MTYIKRLECDFCSQEIDKKAEKPCYYVIRPWLSNSKAERAPKHMCLVCFDKFKGVD